MAWHGMACIQTNQYGQSGAIAIAIAGLEKQASMEGGGNGASSQPALSALIPGPKTKMPHKKTCEAFFKLGWLMGLEPTTTGITILDSTN